MKRGIWVFAVFWSLITGAFVVFSTWRAFHQIRTLGFASTTGTIAYIEKTVSSDSDSTTYGVKVEYQFKVGSKTFTGTRLRYGQSSSSDNWARTFVSQHPKGSRVTVYYSSAAPDDAVLIQGIEGEDLFMAMFLLPFVGVGVMLWAMAFGGSRRGGFAGLRVREDQERIRIWPAFYWVVLAGMGAACGTAFLLTFVIGFSMGFHPPIGWMAGAWALISFIGIATMTWTSVWLEKGNRDIIVDRSARLLRVRKKRAEVSFDQIERIDVRRAETRSSDDGPTVTYAVWLKHVGNGSDLKIYKWTGDYAADARRLAAFIALNIGCAAQDETGQPMATGIARGDISNSAAPG